MECGRDIINGKCKRKSRGGNPCCKKHSEKECSVCLDPSIMLKCGHAVCKECLGNIRELTCPECRSNMKGPLINSSVVSGIRKRKKLNEKEREIEDLQSQMIYLLNDREALLQMGVSFFSDSEELPESPSIWDRQDLQDPWDPPSHSTLPDLPLFFQ